MDNKKNYYRCYSVVLRDFLKKNNIYHILSAYDIKTKCQLWLYYKSDDFKKTFEIWQENNPKLKDKNQE